MLSFLLILSVIPVEIPVIEYHDSCELNHYYDEHGILIFDQLIFRDWNKYEKRFEIVDWYVVKPRSSTNENDCIWLDGRHLRQVQYGFRIETWTQYDPEINERSILPKDKRKGLHVPETVKQRLFRLFESIE